ncbi:MAG TPA: hypothetical protein VN664_08685 [Burkholderiales bacterium]|nr:hypothetical protein [Burkholderiales bacterium]
MPGSVPFGTYVVRIERSYVILATSAPFQVQPTVGGTVTSGGVPLAGATISFPAGALCNPVTDASGHWGCVIPVGWSGTITPSKPGVLFSPASRTFTNVTNHTGSQNFATVPAHLISGTITYDGEPLSGAYFTDVDAEQSGSAVVRATHGAVGLMLFVVGGGECEAFLTREDSKRLREALEAAERALIQG